MGLYFFFFFFLRRELKEEVSRISKSQNVCLSTETKNNFLVLL